MGAATGNVATGDRVFLGEQASYEEANLYTVGLVSASGFYVTPPNRKSLPVTDCGTPPKIKPVTATPVSPATPATKKSAHTVPTHSALVVKITTNRHPWIPLLPTTPKLPKLKL